MCARLPQQSTKDAAVYTLQSRRTIGLALVGAQCLRVRFLRAHAPQPIARGVAARHVIELNKRTQPFVVAQNAQVLQRPSAASEHQNQRQDVSRWLISRGTAGTGQFMIDQVANAHRSQIFAKQRQPACAVSNSSVAASLNGKTVCNDPIAPSR